MKATIAAIDYYLPPTTLTNEYLADLYKEWTAEKIIEKTGVATRHIAAPDETSLDMAVRACTNLFKSANIEPDQIDFILLCTQSPDFFLPTSACILQERLGIPTTTGALDFNLGCSGFIYGLGLAKGLIESGQARNVLLVTSETYSKFIHDNDRSVRTIFGDGAAATFITGVETQDESSPMGPFVYGTDGKGAKSLVVPVGGMRKRVAAEDDQLTIDKFGNQRTTANLYMNGGDVFTFTLRTVPSLVQSLLDQTKSEFTDFDLIVFHQANKYMLENLRERIGIPPEKFLVDMEHVGNTVSATIPIALCDAARCGRLHPGHKVMLVGFGVGYSWGATMIEWRKGLPAK